MSPKTNENKFMDELEDPIVCPNSRSKLHSFVIHDELDGVCICEYCGVIES